MLIIVCLLNLVQKILQFCFTCFIVFVLIFWAFRRLVSCILKIPQFLDGRFVSIGNILDFFHFKHSLTFFQSWRNILTASSPMCLESRCHLSPSSNWTWYSGSIKISWIQVALCHWSDWSIQIYKLRWNKWQRRPEVAEMGGREEEENKEEAEEEKWVRAVRCSGTGDWSRGVTDPRERRPLFPSPVV